MTTILALETSRSLCSIAVQHNEELIEDTRNVARLHNEVVLSMIDEACKRAGIRKSALDVIAFGAGPGSFTGVRIAAAVAQGIAFGTNALIVPVASSMAMAHAALRVATIPPARVVTMTRSHRDAYYLAGFATASGVPVRQVDDVLCTGWPSEFLQSHWLAVGDQPPWWSSAAIEEVMPVQWGGEVSVTAGLIAELGLAAYAANDALEPAAGLPVYVAGDSPWKKTT